MRACRKYSLMAVNSFFRSLLSSAMICGLPCTTNLPGLSPHPSEAAALRATGLNPASGMTGTAARGVVLTQAEERQDRHHDDDKAVEIDDRVHRESFAETRTARIT